MNTDTVPSCPYCNQPSKAVTGEKIYPHRPDLHDLKFFECEPCDARVSCHKESGAPMGRLANAELRKAKQKAHWAFDPMWKRSKERMPFTLIKRTDAYRLLAQKFGVQEVHIGEMDLEGCKKVVQYSFAIRKELENGTAVIGRIDKTGYQIDLDKLEEMSEHGGEYWAKSYKFVMDMQSQEYFSVKQAMWLQEITSKLENEYVSALNKAKNW